MKNTILLRHRILWHVLFWLCWYLFYAFTYGSNSSRYSVEFIVNLYLLPVRMIFTYAFIYYILPKFLLTKKYTSFALLALVHAFLFGVSIWVIVESFFRCFSCILDQGFNLKHLSFVLGTIIINYPIVAIASVVIIFKRWYFSQQQSIVLEKEKLEAELNFLKTQIHPHFLFNTLNNLYALTLIKSDKAPDIVIKLSELLDYMLYNSNDPEVKLQKEINQLQGYIDLEKIRYGDRLNVSFDIVGDASGKYIAPLILIPFVENSFKHGASQDIFSPFIHIQMHIEEDFLNFSIKNSYSPSKNNTSEGIGLKNVQRRLELIYPNTHHLEIFKGSNVFEITLMLEWGQQGGTNIQTTK